LLKKITLFAQKKKKQKKSHKKKTFFQLANPFCQVDKLINVIGQILVQLQARIQPTQLMTIYFHLQKKKKKKHLLIKKKS